MVVSTAVPILLATQTPAFSEQLKLMASPGHRWMWPPCELPHGSNLVQVKLLVIQSCPTLCGTMDYSPPGSSVRRILHAEMLKQVAIPFSRGSS